MVVTRNQARLQHRHAAKHKADGIKELLMGAGKGCYKGEVEGKDKGGQDVLSPVTISTASRTPIATSDAESVHDRDFISKRK